MTRDVVTVNADQSWEEAQRVMVAHDIGRVPSWKRAGSSELFPV
jgi:CBS-domain-containing membrane protein